MDLYLPEISDNFKEELAWQWYNNIPIELNHNFLTTEEKIYLREYYTEAGLLRRWRSPFFRYHYARTFALAASFLFSDLNKKLVILDLGCGTGTQSIAFALLGAKVVSLDMDEMAVRILKKRKAFYEQYSGYSLDIHIYQGDVFNFSYRDVGPIDGLFSLFAFNMMQPSNKLLHEIIAGMSDKGKIAILDGNNLSWLSKLPWRRRKVLSPIEFEAEMAKNEFAIVSHNAGVVFPPVAWYLLPYNYLRKLDNWLGNKSWFFPISHFVFANHQNKYTKE